ncbi:MAG: hypothetical protein AB7G93_14870 [Bdellovibrionales bacterium]
MIPTPKTFAAVTFLSRAIIGVFAITAVLPAPALAQEEESFVHYEAIVNELKASAEGPAHSAPYSELGLQEMALSGGLGVVTSYVALESPSGAAGSGFLKGFEAHVAAHLFSPKVRGELAFRNFAQENLSHDLQADLRELELRLVFTPLLDRRMRLRMGAGLSARFMDIQSRADEGDWRDDASSVPASSLLVGFERKLSEAVSVGPDIAYRSTLASGTFDKSAWDASFRLNASF